MLEITPIINRWVIYGKITLSSNVKIIKEKHRLSAVLGELNVVLGARISKERLNNHFGIIDLVVVNTPRMSEAI